MANQTSGLFETLVIPAAIEAAESLQFTHASIGAIYWDYQIERGAEIGQTLNVNVPTVNAGDASDIGGGPLNPSDTTHVTVPVVLDHHPSSSFVIKSWDKIRTPTDLKNLYMQPKMEALKRLLNQYVTNTFVTPTGFGASSPATQFGVYGGTGDTVAYGSAAANEFTRADLTTYWARLANRGVPVYIPDTLTFLANPIVYGAMLADTNFFQAYVTGEEAAVKAQQKGMLAPTLNAKILFDQQVTQDASSKYIGILLHKWAIAGVTVDPPSNEGLGEVQEQTIFPFTEAPDLGIQVQMQYSIKDQGTVINLHSFCGFKVVRNDFGVYAHTQ